MASLRARTIEDLRATGDLAWFTPALDLLGSPPNDGSAGPFLVRGVPTVIGRAPGRLDVMGGIADYSGAEVLELPLACATYAIAQRQNAPRLDALSLRAGRQYRFAIDLDAILSGDLSSPEALAAWFAGRPADRWAAYVVGTVYRCLTPAATEDARRGIRLLISSDVPEGKGVSSSAALEVASMAATTAVYGVNIEPTALAFACQWAENYIAAAPCGIMDQMTSVLGQRDRLLRLLCQPATPQGHVAVPPGYRFYGIDSGIRHAVTGADYGTVRTAAFMGYRIIADLAGMAATIDGTRVRIDDERWGGYLANITPRELEARFANALPAQMRGSEFLARYAGITDHVTRVDPNRVYPVRAAASHPIYEHDRVRQFGSLLAAGLHHPDDAVRMGELMLAAHASYSACGLGSEGTDRLVESAMNAGPVSGVFGAKITGGGSGGTVAIFGTNAAASTVREIARDYERETGHETFVFDGSGPGAHELGVLRV